MTNDVNETATQKARSVELLTRTNQVTLAVLLALALTVVFASLLWRKLTSDKLVDMDRSQPRAVEFRIDINTADWPEFSLLPGVGETLARRIVESRQAEGRFLSHDDLIRVRGIGPEKLKAMGAYLLPIGTPEGSEPSPGREEPM